MTIQFNPEGHRYALGGRAVPSVTQVMQKAGVIDTRWFTEWAAERGSRVHKIIQYHLEGDIDEDSIDMNDRPYYDALLKFEREVPHLVHEIELKVADETRGFAGTIDMVGSFEKFGVTIVDWKTGPPTRAVAVQLSGYAVALKATTGMTARTLLAVQLKPDGTYRIKKQEFVPRVFLGALEVAKWLGNQ